MEERFIIPSLEVLKQRVQKKPPSYSKPIELGCYSIDGNRCKVEFEKSQLKVYQPADDFLKNANLRIGFETYKSKDESVFVGLDNMLHAAEHFKINLESFDIVTWRGVMTRILCTPFLNDIWKLNGTVRKGTIYLAEEKTVENFPKKVKEMMYGGFKFEALCMVNSNNDNPPISMEARQKINVGEFGEFDILFKSTLGSHRLLLGAEIDGLDETKTNYIELKTTACIKTERARWKFENFKLIKWWVQSFLAGVPTLLIGHRNERLWIERLEKITVDKIPRMVRGRTRWDPNLILSFGELFFTWLRQVIQLHIEGTNNDEDFHFTLIYDHINVKDNDHHDGDDSKRGSVTFTTNSPLKFLPPLGSFQGI